MSVCVRGLLAALFALALLVAQPVRAEKTIAVNDNTGVFDQPSVAMSGATARVAFIGADSAAGPFRVFYAAVNGSANFASLTLARDNTVILAGPVAVDNTDAGNDAYVDARHPKIALLSATEAVILFQALPTGSLDGTHKLFLARLTLSGEAVSLISVRKVREESAGPLTNGHNEDVSFALVTADNTARVAFSNRAAAAPGASRVLFARVALDNGSVVGSAPFAMSDNAALLALSDGLRPVPSLRLDALRRAHIAWAANGNPGAPAAVFYAMLDGSGAADNVAVAATAVFGRTLAWGHPNVAVAATNSVFVFAGDESLPGFAGPIGYVNLNPDADDKDGDPAEVAGTRSFLLRGPVVLPDTFDLFRPEVLLDPFGRYHLTGYGSQGSSASYYAVQIADAFPFATFLANPLSVGLNESSGEIAGDYTKAAFGYLSGRALVFWSGPVAGTTNRNLNVTGVPTVADVPPPHEESGCALVRNPSAGDGRRAAGTLPLLLPALLLAARRVLRRRPSGSGDTSAGSHFPRSWLGR